jgi:putative redox protein
MAEKVIVRQNRAFETEILAVDPHLPDSDHFHPVEHVHQLTPYGMLLVGLTACTAIVLHTYAQHHGVELDEVELRAQYDRVFAEDCEDCEGIEEYREQIEEQIVLTGDLTPQERSRLLAISRHCPIHKMLAHGIEVRSHLAEERAADETA